MKSYPNLTEMGVLHPLQITNYSVYSIAYTDVLRIVYDRAKGSILPKSKTFKFSRVQKSVLVSSDASKTDTVMESDPVFRAVLDELEELMKAKEQTQDIAASILEELRSLEEDIALRSEYIRELVGAIKPG